jgi:nucleoside-diphosphate kinase
MKMLHITRELAERHYGEHKGKPFYEPLVEFITSGPVVAMALECENAVQVVRDMMGKTDPQKSASGTIRADLGMSMSRNVIHGSDSDASAEREIGLFFKPDELVGYTRIDEAWLYGK